MCGGDFFKQTRAMSVFNFAAFYIRKERATNWDVYGEQKKKKIYIDQTRHNKCEEKKYKLLNDQMPIFICKQK